VGHRIGLDYQPVTADLAGAEFLHADATKGFPLEPCSVDHVTMLALIEHLEEPRAALQEAFRVLAPGGTMILTWPAALVDPLLDVPAAIGVVSEEMEAHNHQPRRPVAAWRQPLRGIGFEQIQHRRFELGMNHLLVAAKPEATGASAPDSPPGGRNR
jgi:SAM-dependent methyltransferase